MPKSKLDLDNTKVLQYDVVIIGSGAAGLSLALSLPKNIKIALLAKDKLTEASTFYAQGGVAAVLDEADSAEQHIEDTLIAGAGLCQIDAVRHCVENGKASVDFLLENEVAFTREDNGDLHLTREGGHSQRRIIHHHDATGASISSTLTDKVREQKHIDIYEYTAAIDLITAKKLGQAGDNKVLGVYALDLQTQKVHTFGAGYIALACGGASKAYLYTSNPDIATGDGMAMAWRAGCRVANMEFNQFHPTCLFHSKARSFLMTEALRGEGAYLRLPSSTEEAGERFMTRFDERAELSPRDIVARTIDFEIKRLGIRHVWLDITHKDPDFVRGHFPMLNERLTSLGIDMTKDKIPVVPAAHYTCGGVMVNQNSETDIAGLYAIGETSYTGLHGANRLASNSLLECFVYGMSAAKHISKELQNQAQKESETADLPLWDASKVQHPDEDVVILQNWDECRHTMWNYVGIVRSNKRLERALNRIALLKQEIEDYYQGYQVSKNLIELRNLVCVSEMIVRSALAREESRGLHYNMDYPDMQIYQKGHVGKETILLPPDFQVAG